MSSSIKIGFTALFFSLTFEAVLIFFFKESNFQLGFFSFAFHSLNLLLFILFAVIFKNPIISRVKNFKKGLTISFIFSFFISFYFFSYHKWINPSFLIDKRNKLTQMTFSKEMAEKANDQILQNPDYYRGKTADDLIEIQQENISEFLKPSKVFPLSLFVFLLIGVTFSGILSFLNYFLNK